MARAGATVEAETVAARGVAMGAEATEEGREGAEREVETVAVRGGVMGVEATEERIYMDHIYMVHIRPPGLPGTGACEITGLTY